jgi:hypothetical protein
MVEWLKGNEKMAINAIEERFDVVCIACNDIWTPVARSPLWWKAKKRADKGYLDALHVTGQECGCIQKQCEPDALYRVFGFDDMCHEFDMPFTSFTDAMREYLDASRGLCTVFIHGVSPRVMARLNSL